MVYVSNSDLKTVVSVFEKCARRRGFLLNPVFMPLFIRDTCKAEKIHSLAAASEKDEVPSPIWSQDESTKA